jgi:PBP1b-binding outer membrane lipoprotein LpoB
MSLKRNKIYLTLLVIILLLNSCGLEKDPLDEFEKSRPGTVRALYDYPSTISMQGKIMGHGKE